MYIPQCALQFFVMCFAIATGLSISSPAKAGTGIASLPLFFYGSSGSLSSKPGNLWFGKVMVGSASVLSSKLTNTGTSDITISSASVTGTAYSLSGLSFPMTLAPGNSTKFQVTFAPLATGHVDGGIGFTSNASSSTLYVSLHGTGASAGMLSASPSSVNFGTAAPGNSVTQLEALTNTGTSNVTVQQISANGAGFSVSLAALPWSLAPGQSANFSVSFTPTAGSTSSGSVSIISNAYDSTLSIPLTGAGTSAGILSANPASNSFGSVQVGKSVSQYQSLTNSGGSNATISQANVSGSGFSIRGLSLPVTLTPGQSYTFSTVFAPTSSGTASGSIAIVSNASNSSLTIALSGTATAPGQLLLSPTTLDFGSITVGQSKSLTATLSASGSSVTVSSASTSNPEFNLSGFSFPLALAAGQSTPLTVTFAPQSSGTASGSISFSSNAQTNPTIETLTGTGAAAPQHQVQLSWSASSSSGVSGYNVYRGTVSGGPYSKINSALVVGTTYTDSSVQAGQNYFYVTTALNGSGTESAYSNQVQATVPSP
ncbi:MAG: hypothetical protein DMG88_03455 [Acidobacteria bacterium]|nr:MAG: hypothetical protein DMG88_03455 [Acidobacteriota bacterium]